MRALLILVVAIVVIVVVVLLVRAVLRSGARRWELEERSDGELVSVLARRGSEELLVGSVPFAAEDFEYRIEELRAQGRQKLVALRSGTPSR